MVDEAPDNGRVPAARWPCLGGLGRKTVTATVSHEAGIAD